MAVFRVERTRDYTVMSNYHLKDTGLTLKAKGLLSMMLSLPDEWNYTTRGLASICKESVETIGKTLRELENAGYLTRRQLRGKNGRITDTEYTIFEKPVKPQPEPAPPDTASPGTENPDMVNPDMGTPDMAVPCIYALSGGISSNEKRGRLHILLLIIRIFQFDGSVNDTFHNGQILLRAKL